MSLNDVIAIVVSMAVISLVLSTFRQGGAGLEPNGPLKDRPDIGYSPFTREFDRVCSGAQVSDLLNAEAVNMNPGLKLTRKTRKRRRLEFEASYEGARNTLVERMSEFSSGRAANGAAICILVDHSGSMRDRLPELGGGLRAATEHLQQRGAKVMLAGFTTVGWQGGRSRIAWADAGKPAYPGRLCDLLHIEYTQFDRVSTAQDFDALAEADHLFENVDGEALEWACSQLKKVEAERRILLIVSDGAPVDDSTLSVNGPNILWQHINTVIAAIEADAEIALGAIGIGYDVDGFYSVSATITEDDSTIAAALLDLLDRLTLSDAP